MRIKKNGKVVRITESDLQRIVKKVLNEQETKFKVEDISDEERDYWDKQNSVDDHEGEEEYAYGVWFDENQERLYRDRKKIDGDYVATDSDDWEYFKNEWYKSDEYKDEFKPKRYFGLADTGGRMKKMKRTKKQKDFKF
jgi:hypothetical protein